MTTWQRHEIWEVLLNTHTTTITPGHDCVTEIFVFFAFCLKRKLWLGCVVSVGKHCVLSCVYDIGDFVLQWVVACVCSYFEKLHKRNRGKSAMWAVGVWALRLKAWCQRVQISAVLGLTPNAHRFSHLSFILRSVWCISVKDCWGLLRSF